MRRAVTEAEFYLLLLFEPEVWQRVSSQRAGLLEYYSKIGNSSQHHQSAGAMVASITDLIVYLGSNQLYLPLGQCVDN
jgi:hypothetical protein